MPLCTGPERLRNAHGLKLHPTQKPEALLHRVVLASTAPGEIIVDPFLGTGTTAVVAKRLHRHFIGIERHPAYVEAAWGRLWAEHPPARDVVVSPPAGRETPRIAFGSFVERGILKAGTVLCDRQRRVAATVTPDGTLVSGAFRGSIHKVGAAVQNAPSCNGWTFWHFERDGALVAIDVLRKEDQG
jgi:modification methylase